jgi:2-keto-4-pentenoate hydratase/2-oxohepta-3-ene-1,7-dioic acid hydratase in catechol pathway
MKLLRYQHDGPRIGALKGDRVVDLVNAGSPWRTVQAIAADGPEAVIHLQGMIDRSLGDHPLDELTLLPPVERPGKYLAIGMNYAKHLEEADRLGVARSKHQTWFNKQTTCITGPYDRIEPGVTEKLDYEVELCLVIGKPAKGVAREQAKAHVFGYMVANDVSARDWQFHTPTFTMGKSFDTHGPIGPWVVTADEVPDPHALELRSYVNGRIRQQSNTRLMVHDIWDQIAYLSTAFTLETGDLIATGTPEGVGIGMDPPVFLRSGDVVRCEIDGIGEIENQVV